MCRARCSNDLTSNHFKLASPTFSSASRSGLAPALPQRDAHHQLHAQDCPLQASKGGKLTAEHIYLCFGPSDVFIGKQFKGDPNVDDAALTLAQFSVLKWIKQFPSWGLTVRPGALRNARFAPYNRTAPRSTLPVA